MRALRATCKLRAGGVSYLCIVRGKGGRREGSCARGILHDFTGRAERPQRGHGGSGKFRRLERTGCRGARSSPTRWRLTIAFLTIDFAVMLRRKKRFVPLYVRIGKRKRKDSDAYILSVALRCGRKQGAFEGAVFFGRSPRRAMADINYDTVFWRKEIGGITHTLPTISPDAKYGKPGAETRCEFEKRRGHTIAAQSCATGARNRRWRKASLPRIPVTARSHIAGIERGGDGHAASSFLRMAHASRTDFSPAFMWRLS